MDNRIHSFHGRLMRLSSIRLRKEGRVVTADHSLTSTTTTTTTTASPVSLIIVVVDGFDSSDLMPRTSSSGMSDDSAGGGITFKVGTITSTTQVQARRVGTGRDGDDNDDEN